MEKDYLSKRFIQIAERYLQNRPMLLARLKIEVESIIFQMQIGASVSNIRISLSTETVDKRLFDLLKQWCDGKSDFGVDIPTLPPEQKEVDLESVEHLKMLVTDMAEAGKFAAEHYIPPISVREQIALDRVNRNSDRWQMLKEQMDERKKLNPDGAVPETERPDGVALSEYAAKYAESVGLAAACAQESNQVKPLFPFGYSNGESRLIIQEEPDSQTGAVDERAITLPISRKQAQYQAILEEIRRQGCEPKDVPKNKPGKPGIKASCWQNLRMEKNVFVSRKVFDDAWSELRADREIVDREET